MEVKEAKNTMLQYYSEKHISPVHQDISDINRHFQRREKLYRQCGIPVGLLQGKRILEIGPGSGYNTLAFFRWGVSKVDLVEPNPKGREDMIDLFAEQCIDESRFEMFPLTLEEFANRQGTWDYDLVVCEGFIQQAVDARDILHILLNFPKAGGVVVWTCMDRLGFFVEYLKRIAALGMTCDVGDDVLREDRLIEIFEPQLNKLFGVSRPARDWVQDQILNPAGNGKELFGLGDALEALPDGFHVLGSSPQLIRDISWYKDVRYPKKSEIAKVLKQKLVTLCLAGSSEICVSEKDVESLETGIKRIMYHGLRFEEVREKEDLRQIALELCKLEDIAANVSNELRRIVQEAEVCFEKLASGEKADFEFYPHWAASFGRAMSYMAVQRDMEYA